MRTSIPFYDIQQCLNHFANQPGTILLESAAGLGRYSFLVVSPFQTIQGKNQLVEIDGKPFYADPFTVIQHQLALYKTEHSESDIPFQGGAVGYFGYELLHSIENKMPKPHDDLAFNDLMMGFYDLVMAWDHQEKAAWIFSSGFPEKNKATRLSRAKERCEWLMDQLASMNPMTTSFQWLDEKNIHSNFTKEHYCSAVEKVKQYILEGDIFQANISQAFSIELPTHFSSLALYQRLKKMNPAPFAAYLNWGETKILSASPERFIQSINRQVETRPIKGTRPRGKNKVEDDFLAHELLHSTKDCAENTMIVDLLRNDLSKVCEDNSVQVTQLCGLESYASVHHLVSVITATLKQECDAIDLLRATFPGGSVTGAPKIRAMEVIAEIEAIQRGPYCGCIGYIGFDGNMDTAITIRTYAIKNNILRFQAGGAVVLNSDPAQEYEETLVKAHALKRALCESTID